MKHLQGFYDKTNESIFDIFKKYKDGDYVIIKEDGFFYSKTPEKTVKLSNTTIRITSSTITKDIEFSDLKYGEFKEKQFITTDSNNERNLISIENIKRKAKKKR